MNRIFKECIEVKDYNALREAVGWGKLCEEQAQQEHGQIIHAGDGSLGPGGHVIDPSGVHSDGAHHAAGTHAGGYPS